MYFGLQKYLPLGHYFIVIQLTLHYIHHNVCNVLLSYFRMAKDERFVRLPCLHKGTYADDCLVQRVTQVKSSTYIFSYLKTMIIKSKNFPQYWPHTCLPLPSNEIMPIVEIKGAFGS